MSSAAASTIYFGTRVNNAVWLAVDSIVAHKLRSFLTLLGTIIGVASVILVGAAIEGLGTYASQSTAKVFGSDSFVLAQIAAAGNMSQHEYLEKLKHNKQLHLQEVRLLQSVGGDSAYYSAQQERSGTDIKRENAVCTNSVIYGASASIADIRDLTIVEGRFFTDEEEKAGAHVAVIGDEVKSTLFAGQSPLGKTLRISGSEFTVVGVQEKLGTSFGRSQDKIAYIPITVYAQLYGIGSGVPIFGRAKPGSGLSLNDALDQARVILRSHYHVRAGQPDNFDHVTPDGVRGFISQILGVIAAAVIPLTCMSLVVGGVVIMNIMLVSVTERTSEIGLRKALGARYSDLMLQILIEATTLSLFGGALGIALGAGVAFLLSSLLGMSFTITAKYILLSLGISSVVGIVSGWYPAVRAAKLQPVEALRAD